MRQASLRDSFYLTRIRAKHYVARNWIDKKHINLGGFRQLSELSIQLPLYKDFKNIDLLRYNQNLIMEFKESIQFIWIDNRLTSAAKPFLKFIYDKFQGIFIIDTLDESLTTKPDWIGPMAGWAAPHIPNPKQSSGILLPLGVEEARRATHNLPWLFPKSTPTVNGILVGPFAQTHPLRKNLEALPSTKTINVRSERLKPNQFVKLAKHFKMVYCPRGNGLDTHRTWEVLYRNSIPVVLRNEWSEYLVRLGVPFFLIDDVEELYDLSPTAIASIFKEHKYQLEANKYILTHDFWISRIHSLRKTVNNPV